MTPGGQRKRQLSSWTRKLTGSEADIVGLFERVRDIPFKFASHHDPETLVRCGFGTCAPKHALLALLNGWLDQLRHSQGGPGAS